MKDLFKERCIELYGDYAENTFGIVIIKEDGEYRQIAYPDKRYEILSSYIYENHQERHAVIGRIGDSLILKYYIEDIKKCNVFPIAKPIDSCGKLEKEYFGERIAMMMAYYYFRDPDTRPCLRDFCLSLGLDLSLHIHKYIRQPMRWELYRDLKDMYLRKMTKNDYLAFRQKYDILTIRDGLYYDGWGNLLGRNYEEVSEERNKKALITGEKAIEEVRLIKWFL